MAFAIENGRNIPVPLRSGPVWGMSRMNVKETSVINDIKNDAESRMGKSVEALKAELVKIRTGRAHPSLLEHVQVSFYGSMVPISQAASVAAADSRTLTVTPFDKSMIGPIEKAIMTSDLGLNPMSAGTTIRVPLPPLTEERRRDLIKVVKHEGENAKVAVRNIRRDAIADIKELLKAKDITEDDERKAGEAIQKITDKHIETIDKILADKEKELMEI